MDGEAGTVEGGKKVLAGWARLVVRVENSGQAGVSIDTAVRPSVYNRPSPDAVSDVNEEHRIRLRDASAEHILSERCSCSIILDVIGRFESRFKSLVRLTISESREEAVGLEDVRHRAEVAGHRAADPEKAILKVRRCIGDFQECATAYVKIFKDWATDVSL